MPRAPKVIACACCDKRGRHWGRNLIRRCHERHQRAGTLDQFPRRLQPAETWIPIGPHGKRMLDRYQHLAAIRPPLSTARLAFELGVGERQVERYAAAIRAQHQHAA